MDNKLKTIIGLIIYITFPILLGIVVAKAFMHHNGTLLSIIFFSLIALELVLAVIKFIKYNKRK